MTHTKDWRERLKEVIKRTTPEKFIIDTKKGDLFLDGWSICDLISSVEQEAYSAGRENLLKELGLTNAWNMKEVKSIREEAIQAERERVREAVEKYFKGLIMITDPQATKESLLSKILTPKESQGESKV